MDATDLLCNLASKASELKELLHEAPLDLQEAVQAAAAIGDRKEFDPLPPVFLHGGAETMAQKLWGGMMASQVKHATYSSGRANRISTERLLGAAILPLGGRSHPVLLYFTDTTVVARVNETPMSTLELQLYAHQQSPSPLEARWKGSELAASHVDLREMTGAHIQASGLACIPEYLLNKASDAYHLVRPGPVAFLHMRTPKTDQETKLVENLIYAALVDVEAPGDTTAATLSVSEQVKAMGRQKRKFITVFERAAHSATPPVEAKKSPKALIAAQIARVPALVTAMVAILDLRTDTDKVFMKELESLVETIAKTKMDSAIVQPPQSATKTLSELTDCSSRLCNIRRIATTGTPSYSIAATIFAASDVGLAVRELSTDSINGMWNLAKRVDSQMAMLCIDLGPGRDIKSIRLINSCVDYDLDIDSAGRLLECPWVVVVAHFTSTQEPGGVFIVEVQGVRRDPLQVCDAVRKTYGLEAQRHVKPATVTIEYAELDKRLTLVNNAVTLLQEAVETVKKAPLATAAPVTLETLPVPTIAYTSPELEKLRRARQQWSALGKRAR